MVTELHDVIEDRALVDALRENGIHTPGELPRLTSLCWTEHRREAGLPYTGVRSLAGLESCVELRHIELGGEVRDLSPLAGATKLRELWIGLAAGTSYEPLASLTGLVTLAIEGGRGDLAALANLPVLSRLVLEGAPIDDLRPIADLPALRKVSLYLEKLDISPGSPSREVILGWLARGLEIVHEDVRSFEAEARGRAAARMDGSVADRARKLGELKVAALLDRGGVDPDGNTPLHLAAKAVLAERFEPARWIDRRALVHAILDANIVELDAVNTAGHTALAHMLRYEPEPNLEVVQLLLDRGADANAAAVVAIDAKHAATIDLLMPRLARPWSADVIDALCAIGNVRWMKLAIERGEVDCTRPGIRFDRLPLHAATGAGEKDPELVRMLLAIGADPNACRGSFGPSLIGGWNAEIATLLLDAGADLEGTNTNDDTALTGFLSFYMTEKLHVLLDRGANVRHANKQGHTPLHVLVLTCVDRPEPRFWQLFDRLVELGADVTARDCDDKRPGDYASGTAMRTAIDRISRVDRG